MLFKITEIFSSMEILYCNHRKHLLKSGSIGKQLANWRAWYFYRPVNCIYLLPTCLLLTSPSRNVIWLCLLLPMNLSTSASVCICLMLSADLSTYDLSINTCFIGLPATDLSCADLSFTDTLPSTCPSKECFMSTADLSTADLSSIYINCICLLPTCLPIM